MLHVYQTNYSILEFRNAKQPQRLIIHGLKSMGIGQPWVGTLRVVV